jgi:hypothetical protein
MPQVELLVGVSGLDFAWKPGQIVDMSDEQAAAWADGVRGRVVEPVPPPAPATPPADTADSGVDEPPVDETPADPVPPPRSGAGSGVEAWRAYAAAHEVEVPADAKREQIWVILADAGVDIGTGLDDQPPAGDEPQQ